MSAGTLAGAGVDGNLTPDQPWANPILNFVDKGSQVLSTLLSDASHKINMTQNTTTKSILTSGFLGGWVDEGALKPVGAQGWTHVQLVAKKYAGILPLTNELVDDSLVDLESVAVTDMTNDISEAIDAAILGNGTPAAWGANASFEDAAVAASGNTFNGASYSNIAKMLEAMLAEIEENDNLDRESLMWYVKPSIWAKVREYDRLVNAKISNSSTLADGGLLRTLLDIPVTEVRSSKFPTGVDLFLVDRDKALVGTRQDATVDRDGSASYSTDGGTTSISAFQTNRTLFRAEARFAFNVADVEGFVLGSGISAIANPQTV